MEIVEEISSAVYISCVILVIAASIDHWFELSKSVPTFWIGVGVAMLWFVKFAIIEVIEWVNEVYVVTQNNNDSGGRIYKFHGWVTQRKISESITANQPAVATHIPFGYRVWRFFTGQRIINFTVRSANHVFLEGKRVSNQLEWALIMVRGGKPKEKNGDVGFEGVDDLVKLRMMDGLSHGEFKDAARALVYKRLYG